MRALVRQTSDVAPLKDLDIELMTGDIRNFASVRRAVNDCRQVYHVAADYRLWVPDPSTMYETNVEGTKHVMQAALELGVEKVIYTSTVGVWPGSSRKEPPNEDSLASLDAMVGHYKRSKFIAERQVVQFIRKGLPVIIVNPSTPIGPMDRKPTPTGKIIVDFLRGQIPAYLDSGLNFVDVADVAHGHWLASEYGHIGQRYILGNKNMTLKEFFETLARQTGKKPPKIRLPYFSVLLAAYANEAVCRWITHRHPTIPVTGVKMAKKYMFFESTKAVRELNLPQRSIEAAIKQAVNWFIEQGYVKK